jgi:hypothetical protein
MKKIQWLWLVVASMMMLAQCSKDNPTTAVVTGKQPAICGVLYNTDGSFSQNAIVSIRKKNVLADTSGFTLAKRTGDSLARVTDEFGRFSFSADLEPDLYVVEAINGKNGVLIDSVKIAKKTQSVSLDADTLRPMGAIKGNISLSNGGDPQQFYVLAFGINRFAKVNAGGRFFFDDLAQGVYTIRLLPGLKDYNTLDAGNVTVSEGETTAVATLSPTLRSKLNAPTVTANYDTLRQLVTLRWNKLDMTTVKGYNIYRRNVTLNTAFSTLLDSTLFSDTVFVDSAAIQEFTYEYRVAAKGLDDQEGGKSGGVTATIASYFSVDTVFTNPASEVVGDFFMDFSVSSIGDIFIAWPQSKLIQVYDSMMQPKRQLGNGIWQYQGVHVADDRVLALYLNQTTGVQSILALASEGTLSDTIISSKNIIGFNFCKGLLAVVLCADSAGSENSISLLSIDGSLKKTWKCDHEFQYADVRITDPNKIFAVLNSIQGSSLSKVVVYDTIGNKLSETVISQISSLEHIAFDAQKQRLYVSGHPKAVYRTEMEQIQQMQLLMQGINTETIARVCVFENNSSVVAYYNVIGGDGVNSLELQNNGSLLIGVRGSVGVSPVKDRIIKLKPLQR